MKDRMTRLMFRALIIATTSALSTCSASSFGAEFVCEPSGDYGCTDISLTGQIRDGDEIKLINLLDANPRAYTINLNSSGGDLYTSFLVGEIVRDQYLSTFIWPTDRCDSACFFLWIAGIWRSGDPTIHRPYLPGKGSRDMSPQEAEAIYLQLQQDIKEYLAKMDAYGYLPSTFVSTMFSTPPSKMMPLSSIPGANKKIVNNYLPHVEQQLLDRCGSLVLNVDCRIMIIECCLHILQRMMLMLRCLNT